MSHAQVPSRRGPPSTVERLADWTLGVPGADIPERAITQAKLALLDGTHILSEIPYPPGYSHDGHDAQTISKFHAGLEAIVARPQRRMHRFDRHPCGRASALTRSVLAGIYKVLLGCVETFSAAANRASINRPSRLRDAGRAHRSFRLIKTQVFGIPVQPRGAQ